MKKTLFYVLSAVVLISILGGIAFKLKQNKAISEKRVFHYEAPEILARTQEGAEPSPPSEVGNLIFTGTFEAFRESRISAEMQGKINSIMVDAGSVVSRGQTLVQLDDALLQLQLQSVDVQMEGLSADVRRYSILAEADAVQGIQLEKAQLGLKSAQVQRATIQEQIRKTHIKAPFNGVVYGKLNEVGGFAAPGIPLLHLLDLSQMKFTINVPEMDLKYFKVGRTYEITADAFPDKKLTGKVSLIASKANVGNSFQVQFTVSNFSNNALRVGMFGKIELANIN